MIWVEFFICAALVVVVSMALSRYGDMVAEKSGLGRAWVGAILLAGVTSLPELASGVAAVTWLNAPNLAAGSIMGSCLFNLVLIALLDLAYQPGSILAKAQEGHVLSGGIGILLLGLVVAGVLLGPGISAVGLLGVSWLSLAIVGLYLLGMRLIARFEQQRLAQVLDQSAEARQYDRVSKARAYTLFALCALVVLVLGVWLAQIGDRLSAETGLSRTFVGGLFLALSTSLPEIASGLAAVRLGAIDMAISNALGSNLFNIMLFAVYDLFDGYGNFFQALSQANGLAGIITIMMTAVAIISLIYRASPRTPYRVNWDGVTLAGMYVVAMGLIYQMGS